MKRRDFFKKGSIGIVAAGAASSAALAASGQKEYSERSKDNWINLSTGKKEIPLRKMEHACDVAVLGGGLAGISAAVSAARNGAKTILVQDRSVLGGNSSSEMRVHVHGVSYLQPDRIPERETGIIEEILLHNRFNNPQESFSVWDHVLYDFVTREPNIELLMNTQAIEAIMHGNLIRAAKCWQSTTESEIILEAKQFIDCSGDGLLAATSGAEYRTGREGKAEFNESYAPGEADGWQMGATLLMSSKDYGKPMPYSPPNFAIKYEAEKSDPGRKFANFKNGIWWIEVGSENDIIADAEINRHKLMGYLHGVWDYIKNSGKFPEAENMALDWVGALPGRRESRRFIGDYILSEKDLTEHRHHTDAIGYGGWPIDEHCWAGIENLEDPPSYWHHHFKKVYEIPYRCLYSKNIPNLSFAGRNISQTHIALSSSRVMATCAVMGQAAGTGAALCIKENTQPRDIANQHMEELQEQLLRDDVFIPNRPAADSADIAQQAKEVIASSTGSGNVNALFDGVSRDFEGEIHHWASDGLPATVQLEWEKPVNLAQVEIKCDTNTKRNLMMLKESLVDKQHWNAVPLEMVKSLKLEVRVKGKWQKVTIVTENRTRLIKIPVDPVKTSGIKLTINETYGAAMAKLFELRCYEA